MNYYTARALMDLQAKRLRRISGERIMHNGYEYRLLYCGGFAPTVKIDRREIGKRNFKYFKTADVHNCGTADDAMKVVCKLIGCGK